MDSNEFAQDSEWVKDTFEDFLECEREYEIAIHKEGGRIRPEEYECGVEDLLGLIAARSASMTWHQLDRLDRVLSLVMRFARSYQQRTHTDPEDGLPEEYPWPRYKDGDPRPRSGEWWPDAWRGILYDTRETHDEDVQTYYMDAGEMSSGELLDLAALVEQGWEVFISPEHTAISPGYGAEICITRLRDASCLTPSQPSPDLPDESASSLPVPRSSG